MHLLYKPVAAAVQRSQAREGLTSSTLENGMTPHKLTAEPGKFGNRSPVKGKSMQNFQKG